MLERFLLYEAFLRCTEPKDYGTLKKLKPYLTYLMFLYKNVVNRSGREKGEGDNIVKFHLTLHIVDMIIMYGLPANFSGGPHETRHIFFAKETGETSQKRIHSLDHQIAKRQVVAIARNRYQQEILRHSPLLNQSEKTGVKTLYGTRYSYDFRRKTIVDNGSPASFQDPCLQTRLTEFLDSLLSQQFVRPQNVQLYTELREERAFGNATKLYRAHPSFGSDETQPKRGWFDWCYTKWRVKDPDTNKFSWEKYACHIRCFVKLPAGFLDPSRAYQIEDFEYYTFKNPKGTADYAIIETCSKQQELMSSTNRKSWFFTTGKKSRSRGRTEPDLFLQPVSWLSGYLSAFRDPQSINESLDIKFAKDRFIFVKPQSQWSDRFIELADEFSKLDEETKQARYNDYVQLSSIHPGVLDPHEDGQDPEESAADDEYVVDEDFQQDTDKDADKHEEDKYDSDTDDDDDSRCDHYERLVQRGIPETYRNASPDDTIID